MKVDPDLMFHCNNACGRCHFSTMKGSAQFSKETGANEAEDELRVIIKNILQKKLSPLDQ